MANEIREKFYDVAVSDLDGTLLRADGTVSEKTKKTISDFCKRGGIFSVCSGRMTPSVLNVCRSAGLKNGYAISYNGAEITDIASGENIYKNHVSNADCLKLIEYADTNGYYIQTYPEDVLAIKKITSDTNRYASVCGVSPREYGENLKKVFVDKGYTSGKVLFYIRDGEKEKMLREISALVCGSCNVINSNAMHIDIMNKGVSKGDTMLKLVRILGKNREKLICFGDELNDESMLSVAACSAVPKNGNSLLIQKADLVIDSCDEGGVGICMDKYCV